MATPLLALLAGKTDVGRADRAFHRRPMEGFVSGHLLSAFGACHFDRRHLEIEAGLVRP
jgi:hypothetical protein